MIQQDIIFYDFETGSKMPKTTQPIQLAAVCIDVRNLKIRKNSEFESLIKPIMDDEEAIAAGLDPLEDEALQVNGKTREELADAPLEKNVFESFVEYTKKYAKKRDDYWTYPYRSGFNNKNFDDIIIDRLSEKYKCWDEKRGQSRLFRPMGNIDLYQEVDMMFNGKKLTATNSLSMDTLRKFMNLPTENAHDALVDVVQGADILIGFLKMYRKYAQVTNFRKD